MKTALKLSLLLVLLLGSQYATAQYAYPGVHLSLWGAYGRSDFQLDSYTQAANIPLGLRLSYGGVVKAGLELSSNQLSPYTYEYLNTAGELVYENQITQQNLAGIVAIDLSYDKPWGIYLKGGGGVYRGAIKQVYNPEISNFDDRSEAFNNSIGLQFGLGFIGKFGDESTGTGLLLEYAYHMLKRETEAQTLPSFTANSWEIRAGLRFEL